MALTADGNYVAALPDPPSGGFVGSGIVRGTGAPDANTPISSGYIDTSNGHFYVNTTGDSSAWTVTSGGGGGTNNQSGAGSPIGVKTPAYVGQTYTDTNGGFWQAVGLTSSDWQQVA